MMYSPALLAGSPAALAGGESDPDISSVVFLSSFNGTNGATAATDDSASSHAITFNGDAALDTSVKKFGTASVKFSGAGHLSLADSDDWYLPGAFTVEFWARVSNTSITGLLSQIGASNNWNFQMRWLYSSSTLKRYQGLFYYSGGPANYNLLPSSTNIDQAAFQHVVLDRDSSDVMRIYTDGVMGDKEASATGGFNSTVGLKFGVDSDANAFPMTGWIDEVRITKGVSRYGDVYGDSGFTPPTEAFPRV